MDGKLGSELSLPQPQGSGGRFEDTDLRGASCLVSSPLPPGLAGSRLLADHTGSGRGEGLRGVLLSEVNHSLPEGEGGSTLAAFCPFL